MDESSINPYQSPLADQPGEVNLDIQPSCPAYTLYSVGSVTLSAVLGSLLAGGIVMAINYKRLGQGVEAINAVGWSAVATVVVITAGMLVPNLPNAAFLAPQIIGMYYLAKSLQGPAIDTHQRRGGRLASAWGAAGIGTLTGIVVIAVLVGGFVILG